MKIFTILIFTFFHLSTAFGIDEDLKHALQEFNAKKAPEIDYQANCASCAKAVQQYNTATLHSAVNNIDIPLTVLNKKDAEKIFDEMANTPNIPFGYPFDGCYARAHKMVQLLEKKGIIAAKGWASGDIYVDTPLGEIEWSYHVAPIVLVQEKNGPVPYIIDPSLSKTLITFKEWKALMLVNKKSMINDDYFTNRFAYSPDERSAKYKEYDKIINLENEETLKQFMKLQNELKKK